MTDPDERAAAGVSGDGKLQVTLAPKQFRRYMSKYPGKRTPPRLEVVAVNIGRVPAHVSSIGIGTQKGAAYSTSSAGGVSMPAELPPGGELRWETPYLDAEAWTRDRGAKTFFGRAQMTSLKTRKSRALRLTRKKKKAPTT